MESEGSTCPGGAIVCSFLVTRYPNILTAPAYVNRVFVLFIDRVTAGVYYPGMNNAERIINKFGGLTALANLLGHKFPTTVQYWKTAGFIPARQQQLVLKAARENDVELEPADFFEE